MSKSRLRQYAPISLIIGFALSLRLWRLSAPSGYIFDEVYYAKNANSLISHGVELNEQMNAEFVVHPPVGKWLIGIGIKLFGNNEFGWRVIAALVGTASVLMIYLVAQRLFNSAFLSNTAAALMALDGLHLVMSRVALLDIFLMFFILLAFYLILTNNLWASGVVIGLAGATKWSGFFLIPLLILLTINFKNANIFVYIKRIAQFVLVPSLVYLVSWSGWIITSSGWARSSGSNFLSSLWNYHLEILNFHQGLTEKHSYAIGTPVLWWFGVFAIAITFGLFLTKGDRVSAFILAGIAGTYLPWFLFQSRTMFYFYAISILPFLILALIYTFNWAMNFKDSKKFIYGFIFLVALNFLYFLPILIGVEIPYSQWLARMWFPSWI